MTTTSQTSVNDDARCTDLGLSPLPDTEFIARGRLVGTSRPADRPAGTVNATIRMRQVGWLDQRGRFWDSVPPAARFDGGSLMPLLIQIDMED